MSSPLRNVVVSFVPVAVNPVVATRPVMLVATPLAGVPSAGVTNVLFDKVWANDSTTTVSVPVSNGSVNVLFATIAEGVNKYENVSAGFLR